MSSPSRRGCAVAGEPAGAARLEDGESLDGQGRDVGTDLGAAGVELLEGGRALRVVLERRFQVQGCQLGRGRSSSP